MKRDDAEMLYKIQKNTRKAMMIIEMLIDKTSDDAWCLMLSKDALYYAQVHNQATKQLLKEKGSVYRGNHIEELAAKGRIHAETFFDISTMHLANLMIRKSSEGLADLWGTIRHHRRASDYCMEIAEELAEFEKESIQRYKEFL